MKYFFLTLGILFTTNNVLSQILASQLIKVNNTADTITLNQIINPIRGSIAYVNSDKSIYVYDGTEWKSLMYPPIKSFYLSQDTLGGIVAYIYTDEYEKQRGLIISIIEGNGLNWQNSPFSLTNANSFWDGQYNTNQMTNSPIKNWLTSNFSNEWYIPSNHEIILLAFNALEINKGLVENNFPEFRNRLWSSTEHSINKAYIYYTGNYSILERDKDEANGATSFSVREVRKF